MALKSIIVIPTYNEKENIGELIKEIIESNPRSDFHIVVVDDNSTDGTAQIVDDFASRSERVRVIHRKEKKGLGTAYITGMKYGLENGYDLIFTMDGDLSHQPCYLKDFVTSAANHDLIIGSRYTNGISIVNWPLRRLFLSLAANKYVKTITRMNLSDFTSGYRCWKRDMLEKINLDAVMSEGYAFLVEMAYRAYKKGAKIGEVPIVFVERKHGKSKISNKVLFESIIIPWKLLIMNLFNRL